MVRLATMMTVKDVARYLRVHDVTIYRMIHRGRLPAVRIGRVWRFHKDHIDRWLTSNGTGNPSARRSQRAGPSRKRRKGP